jgi:hypothetical protein
MPRWRGKTAERAISDIREFHRVGRQSLKTFPDRLPHGRSKRLARFEGMNNVDQLEKARAFAKDFTLREMEDMCAEITNGKFPVGVSHLIRLLWLPKNRRWKFLRDTIQGRWSCRRLGAAIQLAIGRRRRAGRPPSVRDAAEGLQKLRTLCEQWRRLYRVVRGTGGREDEGATGVLLPPKLEDPMRRCDSAIEEFYESLRRYRKT